MIVGFTDRAGVHEPHVSNVVRKSGKHCGQDKDTIFGRRMRGSTSCDGRAYLATPPDPSTRQVTGIGHPCEGSLPHDILAKTLHETTDEKLEEFEGRSRKEVKIKAMQSRSLTSVREWVDCGSSQNSEWTRHEASSPKRDLL